MSAKAIKELFNQGKYQELVDQLAQLETEGIFDTFTEKEQIECIYYKSYALGLGLGQWEQSLQSILAARNKYTSPKDKSLLLALLSQQIFILAKKTEIDAIDRLDETLEVITEGNAILESLKAKERETGAYWIAFFEERKGSCYYSVKKDWNSALGCMQRALALRKEIGEPRAVGQSLYNLGLTYQFKGDLDLALDYYQQTLSIERQEGNLQSTAGTLVVIGGIYTTKGELDMALDYHQQALSIYEKIGTPHLIAYALNNIGFTYWNKGELDAALECYQRYLTLQEGIGDSRGIAWGLFLLGTVFRHKGGLNLALNCWGRSLTMWEALGNDLRASQSLFGIILLSLDLQAQVQAQKYLSKLQKLHKRTPEEKSHHQRQLSDATR
ncbi:MAG: tetratricopeptide repeat protein [Candidatus Hodarchaeota archaeon]